MHRNTFLRLRSFMLFMLHGWLALGNSTRSVFPARPNKAPRPIQRENPCAENARKGATESLAIESHCILYAAPFS